MTFPKPDAAITMFHYEDSHFIARCSETSSNVYDITRAFLSLHSSMNTRLVDVVYLSSKTPGELYSSTKGTLVNSSGTRDNTGLDFIR